MLDSIDVTVWKFKFEGTGVCALKLLHYIQTTFENEIPQFP